MGWKIGLGLFVLHCNVQRRPRLGASSTSAEPALLKAISQARGAELKRNVFFSHLCTEEEGEGEGEREEREEDLEDGHAAMTTTPSLSAS